MTTHHTRNRADRSQRKSSSRRNPTASTHAANACRAGPTPLKISFTLEAVVPSPSAAPRVATPSDVVTLLGAEMGALVQEQLRVLLLDMLRGMASQAHTCATLGDRQPGASPRLLEVRRR